MTIRKYLYLVPLSVMFIFLALLSCAKHDEPTRKTKLHIVNNVRECIEITPQRSYQENNVSFISIKLVTKKNPDFCGCKSPLLSYQAKGKVDQGINSSLSYGIFSPKQRDHLALMINPDVEANYFESVTIYINCDVIKQK
ncbi:MAG: DUF2195 family protein [Smithellaceae bacterium]